MCDALIIVSVLFRFGVIVYKEREDTHVAPYCYFVGRILVKTIEVSKLGASSPTCKVSSEVEKLLWLMHCNVSVISMGFFCRTSDSDTNSGSFLANFLDSSCRKNWGKLAR